MSTTASLPRGPLPVISVMVLPPGTRGVLRCRRRRLERYRSRRAVTAHHAVRGPVRPAAMTVPLPPYVLRVGATALTPWRTSRRPASSVTAEATQRRPGRRSAAPMPRRPSLPTPVGPPSAPARRRRPPPDPSKTPLPRGEVLSAGRQPASGAHRSRRLPGGKRILIASQNPVFRR